MKDKSHKINAQNTNTLGRRSGNVVFPRRTLDQSLFIANTIWSKNSGNPMTLQDLSKQLNLSPNGGGFRTSLMSSMRYGLTVGSYVQNLNKTISLTELGTSIVAPNQNENVNELKLKAFLSISIYDKLSKSMIKKPIPPIDVLENELVRAYGIISDDKTKCATIFLDNIRNLGLIKKIGNAECLVLSENMENTVDATQKNDDQGQNPHESTITSEPVTKTKQIFVAHGKNHKPLEQLKSILIKFNVPFKIAVDESNQGRPISQKISDLMNDCTSAIFIFTKDEKIEDKNGVSIYKPSDNVVFELGAASVLYGNKIVIFKQNGVTFGSDFKDLGYIPFDDDQLNAKAGDLMKELIDLNLLKLSPT